MPLNIFGYLHLHFRQLFCIDYMPTPRGSLPDPRFTKRRSEAGPHDSPDLVSFLFVAMANAAEKLDVPGSHTPRLHGLSYLRRSEGAASRLHQQAWQVNLCPMLTVPKQLD